MSKKIILSCLVVLFTINVSAQNRSGYIGKKNMISVFTTSNFMYYNLVNTFLSDDRASHHVYFKKDNTKKDNINLFRIDYRLSYQRLISNRFAIGIEYAFEKVKLDAYNYTFNTNNSNFSYINYQHYSSPVFKANSFLLTFEFYKRDRIAGRGFTFSCGIGPKFYSFSDKPNYRLTETLPISESQLLTPKLNYIGVNAFYQMAYKHPINKFLSFEIGLRFHTGFIMRKNYNNNQVSSGQYVYLESSVYNQLNNLNLLNLASLKTGFVITL